MHASPKLAQRFLTVSFSGCGHLLPYHLGVSSVLLEGSTRAGITDDKNGLPRIKAVAGSSAGAIAAVLHARLPHRVEEFAEKFISDRGHALSTLKTMLYEEESAMNTNGKPEDPMIVTNGKRNVPPQLEIATTKCIDGSHHLFTFSGCFNQYSSISSAWKTDHILDAVEASCKIPRSFHLADIIFKTQSISYPDSDGILIDGDYHVDGGIAAPAPRTSRDNQDDARPIIVSPISKGLPFLPSGDGKEQNRISPIDKSWRLLPFSNINCRGDFEVKPSAQNLKALRMASGMVSSYELQKWYDEGIEDAHRFVQNCSD